MRFCVVCNGTVYYGWATTSDAYDWATRNLHLEFQVYQLIRVDDLL